MKSKKYFNLKTTRVSIAVAAVLICALTLVFTGCDKGDADGGSGNQFVKEEEQPVNINISCVGDVMVHDPQIPAQYDASKDNYDFTNNFMYVRPYIEDADFAICNLESTFGGGPNYSGYPMFNTPDSLAVALKEAGWDLAVTANNHMLDTGVSGLKRTLEVARHAGLLTSGSQLPGEKNYTVTEVKGIKIGVIAYTYETPRQDGARSLNGNPIPTEAEPLINSFDYAALSEDLNKVTGAIESARSEGAELVLCYFHWGGEYKFVPNEYQQQIAAEAAGAGADVIFASHPHVVQPLEYIQVAATGKNVPVFYSMGNFISNQRQETLDSIGIDSRYTEQGIIAEVEMEYMKSTKEVLDVRAKAIPLWVEKYWKNDKNFYTVIPILSPEYEKNPELAASGHLTRATQALRDITKIIGSEQMKGQDDGENATDGN